ncbi:MAG: molybdate ABC transporter permease subunit [Nitrospina sp.]|nr:molybdate ABC transporter permease subunit [Nitrospina sp.]
MGLNSIDFSSIWVTLQLATTTIVILLIIGTPIAWWLANTCSKIKVGIEAVVALPLVLPPTVLGFYLLIMLGPNGWIGGPIQTLTGSPLSFTFAGLVFASTLYSLPFVVQPLQSNFESIGNAPMEAAYSLGASKRDAFFSVILPLSRRGYLTATVLGFAHTLGEFGVVLMVGGNIPGKTKVISIEIFDRVEVMEYAQAHILSAGLLLFSFLVLVMVYSINKKLPVHV